MKRIIVCGFGFMGQTHTANIFRHPDLELAAVVDFTPKSAIKPVSGNLKNDAMDWEKLQEIPFFPTLTEALSSTQADAVLIAAPTRFHFPLAMEAIKSGKHVFVEKPLCFRVDEGTALLHAVQGKNLVFQVGHCVRFIPAYRTLRKIFQEQTYGKLRFLDLLRMTGTPNWGAWKNLDVSLTSVSGPLFDLNIHDIDYALSLLGEPQRMTAAKTEPFDSLFHSEWDYPDCTIQIKGGFMLPSTVPFRSAFRAVFDHAVLEYDSRIGNSITVSSEKECSKMDCSAPNSYYYEELDEFASAMIHGTFVQCGLRDGFNAVKTCYELKALLEV